MNQIIRSRDRARLFSMLLIAAITAISALTFQATVARAEEPSTPPASGETTTTTSGDTGSSGATSGSTGTGGDGAASGGDGTGGGGDGAATGGNNAAGNGTDATGGGAAATGGDASADGAGGATSTNTATDGVPADAGPGSTTTTNTVTDDQTGATGSTGATQTETASSPATTSSTGAGNPGVTPATPEAPTAPTAPTALSNANVSSGDATAIGNLSQTDIVQIVIAIVNITMPNVNAADIVGPLVTINQTAEVTNAGIASALTGGNTAVASLISTVAGGGQVSAQQLAGLATSGTADVNSGAASAVGNLSWTEVMQIASVITSVNGDASLTSQLTQIQQSASVTNAGIATADTGGNKAEVSVSVTNGNAGVSDDAPVDPNPGDPSPPAGAQAEVDPYPGDSNHRVLLWGPAPSADAVVWIYVDGRDCKTAKVEESVDFKGAYDWWSYVYPGECGAKNGSRLTFLVGAKMKESVVFDNRKRESPQITFQALIQTDLAAKGARR